MQDVQTPIPDRREILRLPHTILILDERASVVYSGHATRDQVYEIIKRLWPGRAQDKHLS